MTSLVQHLTDPQQPEPDITHQQMLDQFTRELMMQSMINKPELKTLYTEHKMENGDVAIVLNGDLRGLLYSNISRDHLERMIHIVCEERVIGTEAIRSLLEGTFPSAITSGIL